MVKVIVVNGKPESGKTTFENFCRKLTTKESPVHLISTIDYVKGCAFEIGWDGEKTPAARKFLSDLKKAMAEYKDIPYEKVSIQIKRFSEDGKNHFVFIDSREPDEIARFVDDFNASTILVRRPDIDDKVVSNESDYNVFAYNYDFIIENNRDLTQLEESAKLFMATLKGENNGKLGN